MAKQKKVILTCAVTGAIHTPGMSPYLPCGIRDIIQAAAGAARAGASMLHIHARLDDGRPSSDPEVLRQILRGIKEETDAVVGITTGGAIGMTLEERLAVIPEFKPEIASCNGGSINFSLSELTQGLNPKYDWEIPFLRGTYAQVFKNTFADLEYAINIMNENGTKQEFEIFDLGQVNNVAYFVKKGIVPKPIYLQFVFGVMGGIPLTLNHVAYIAEYAKKTLGDDIQYSIVSGGRRMYRYEAFNAINGGNCRVGMEDSLYINRAGELAASNAAQVEKMIQILQGLEFEIATPDEAREMLRLKGSDAVGF
jgi:uncharacterized protein (DUF849 family)